MRMKPLVLAALLLLPTLLSAAQAPPAFLVKDIGDTVSLESPLEHGFISSPVELDGILYFFSDDGIHGAELWRTDGTTAGTRMIRDLCPGVCSSYLAVKQSLTPFQHKVYWYGSDGAHQGLMASDGTPQGTGPVLDPTSPAASHFLTPLGEAGGRLLLSGETSGGSQGELWATDGTADGTVRLRIFRTSAESPLTLVGKVGGLLIFRTGSELVPQQDEPLWLWATDGTADGTLPLIAGTQGMRFSSAVLAGGRLFFDISSSSGNVGWVSDGTPAGTRPLPGVFFDSNLTAVGSQVFFVRPTATSWDLWRSNGTPDGTALVKALTDFPSDMTAIGDRLFFRTLGTFWVSDGTADGTLQLQQLLAPSGFLVFGGRLAFFAYDGAGYLGPWTSDGTPAGTYPLAELPPGSSNGQSLGALGNRWLFTALDAQGWFLWSSDGTPGSLTRIHRLDVQTSSSPKPLAGLDGTLIFAADDPESRRSLWRTDGSAAGTAQITAPSSILPGDLQLVIGQTGNRLFFVELIEPSGTGTSAGGQISFSLWTTDGTAAGTRRVPSGAFPLSIDSLTAAQTGGFLYVAQGTRGQQKGLFKTDGTDAGTVFLHRFNPRTESLEQLTGVSGRLFFLVLSSSGERLWTSDGTVAGTKPVVPAQSLDDPVLWGTLGSRLLFTTGQVNRELWTSDGTDAGTKLVVPGQFFDSLVLRGVLGSRLLFTTGLGANRELWTSDGTADGTHSLATISSPPETTVTSPANGFQAVANGRSFFVGYDDAHGPELWATDGTAAGTHIVADIASGPAGSSIEFLTAMGRRVYFAADDGVHGRELWTSDGTAAGTRMVADIAPGAGSSLPANLTEVDGRLLFSADDGIHGVEPWVSDGTAEGTRMLQDIAPGALPSSPSNFFVSGDYVYFSANDAAHGFELWAVPRSALRAHP